MRRFSHLDNFEPSRTLSEKFSYWIRSLFELAVLLFAASLILGTVFQVGSWALHFFNEGSWLAFAITITVSVMVIAWMVMGSNKQRLWLFVLLPMLVAIAGPFVSHYLL